MVWSEIIWGGSEIIWGDSLGMKQVRKALEHEEEDERITKTAVTTHPLLAGANAQRTAVAPADWLCPELGLAGAWRRMWV